MTEPNQDECIEACLEKDLLAEEGSKLLRWLQREGGHFEKNPNGARDCAQHVLAKVLDRFTCGAGNACEPPRDLRSYLKAVAERHIVDLYRRRQLRGRTVSLDEVGQSAWDLPDPGPTPEQQAIVDDLLRLCCTFLSRRDGRVFMLRADQHLEYDEIASVVGLPKPTVRGILARMRERFRDVGLLEVIEDILSERGHLT